MSSDRTTTPWQKATASDANGSCFELRRDGDRIELRDSKHPAGKSSTISPQPSWPPS